MLYVRMCNVSERPIFESAVICEYLEDTVSPALHPENPLTRARHRSWIELASATLNNIWSLYTAKDEAAYSDAANALIQRFVQIEGALRDGPYFDGKEFSLVAAPVRDKPKWRAWAAVRCNGLKSCRYLRRICWAFRSADL
jgi:glutathione S-transferase